MTDERIDIQITDKVSPKISEKLGTIAGRARKADRAIEKLKERLDSLDGSGFQKLVSASAKMTNALARETNANARLIKAKSQLEVANNRVALSNQKLASEAKRTELIQKQVENADARAAVSKQKIATEIQQTATAQSRASTAAQVAAQKEIATNEKLAQSARNTAVGKQRLAQETAKTATAQSRAAQAASNAANADARSRITSTQLAESKVKLRTSFQRLGLAAERVKTQVQQTSAAMFRSAQAAKNATNAKIRAEIQTLKLANANNKLTTSTRRSNQSMGQLVRTTATFVGAAFSGVAIVRAADSYTVLENKLRNVSDSTAQLAQLTDEVFDIAVRTRTPVQETAQSFQRFDLALKGLGASQRESLELTETVNKALIVSGATTNEQSAALLQLSQAFNKGKLDGDEFRTVMELIPTIGNSIAKELGVARGELLNLAPQGVITAEVMRQAFANAREEIAERFAKTVPTMQQAFTVLRNEATRFFGEINKSLGITQSFAKGILAIGLNMDKLAAIAATTGSILLVAFGTPLLNALRRATTATLAFNATLLANPIGLLIVGTTALVSAFFAFKDELVDVGGKFVEMGDLAKATFQIVGERIKPVTDFIEDSFGSAFDFVSDKLESFFGFYIEIYKGIGSFAKSAANEIINAFIFAYKVVEKSWDSLPDVMGDVAKLAGNKVLEAVEFWVNGSLTLLRGLLKAVDKAAVLLGKEPIFNTELKIDLSNFKQEVGNSFSDLNAIIQDNLSVFGTDQIGNVASSIGSAIVDRAAELSKTRTTDEDNLRKAELAKIAAEAQRKYAVALSETTSNLAVQSAELDLYGRAQVVGQEALKIKNKLLKEGITLADKDLDQISNSIAILEQKKLVNTELNNIYSETIGQENMLAAKVQATSQAYADGLISLENYQIKMAEVNTQASELALTMGNGNWADVFIGALGTVIDGYQGLLPEMEAAFGSLFETLTEGFANSIGRGIVYAEDLGESLKNVARNAVSTLISAMVEMGVQWIATQVLQKKVAATGLAAAVATNQAAAVALGAAYAGPAALASLATSGANAGPALAGINATVAVAKSLALPGLKEGGYTGNGGVNQIAGVVHGQEFVMDASSTSRLGVGNLQALQRGAADIQQGGRNSSNPSVSTGAGENTLQGQSGASAGETRIVNLIDPEMTADYLISSEGEQVIVNVIRNNSETVRHLLG